MSEDIRTTRTKRKIKESFLELLKTYGYDQISVSDIAKLANINRVTFYTHYIDKACLLADLTEDIKKKFIEEAKEQANFINNKSQVSKFIIGLISALFDIFYNNHELIILLESKENAVISKVLEQQIGSCIINILHKINDLHPLKYSPKYVAAFLAPAYVSFIMNYVNDPNKIDKELFKQQLLELTENIIKSRIFTK